LLKLDSNRAKAFFVGAQLVLAALIIAIGIRVIERYVDLSGSRSLIVGRHVSIAWLSASVASCLGLTMLCWEHTRREAALAQSPRIWTTLASLLFLSSLIGMLVLPSFATPYATFVSPELWQISTHSQSIEPDIVYFPNGSAFPETSDLNRVKATAKRLASCRGVTAELFGYASSLPFSSNPQRSDTLNLDLALRRLQTIRQAVASIGISTVIHDWTGFSTMKSDSSFFKDTDGTRRLAEREILNRRVLILWKFSDSNCTAGSRWCFSET